MLACARIMAAYLKTIIIQLFFQVTDKMAVRTRKVVVFKAYLEAKGTKKCLYGLLLLILSP